MIHPNDQCYHRYPSKNDFPATLKFQLVRHNQHQLVATDPCHQVAHTREHRPFRKLPAQWEEIFGLPSYQQKKTNFGRDFTAFSKVFFAHATRAFVSAYTHSCQYLSTVGWFERFCNSVSRPLPQILILRRTNSLSPRKKTIGGCIVFSPGPSGTELSTLYDSFSVFFFS